MELLEQARFGNSVGVKKLIQQGVHVDTMNRYSNETALYLACVNGRTEVAQYLLDNGASVNFGDDKPLIAAVRYNHYDCVKLLLQSHADANCTNSEQESPMSVALQTRLYSIVLLLVEYDVIPSPSLANIASQLLDHAKVEHAKAIQKLIDANVVNMSHESTFMMAFNFAFKQGAVELAERILSSDTFSKQEHLYPTAAYYSAKNNWPTILSKLLEKGVDINALTKDQTPLYVACEEGHESIVRLLLDNGADPDDVVTSIYSSSPLQIAVRCGNAMIVDMMLERGAKMNPSGVPLLHIACSGAAEWKKGERRYFEDMLSVIRLLLQRGASVNDISDRGDTALYRACKSQQLAVVQVLLEAGADVNLTSKRLNPLIAAFESRNVRIFNFLVKAGADVKCRSSNNGTCLHAVINAYPFTTGSYRGPVPADIVNIVESLIEAGVDVNACSSQGETALYRASKAGYEQIVRLLLEAGAEIDGSTIHGPLHAACEHGHTQVVDMLLQLGADPNISSTSPENYFNSQFLSLGVGTSGLTTSSGSLPICCAVQKGHADVVNLLLKHGADVNKRDQSGKSAVIHVFELMTSRRCNTLRISKPLEQKYSDILKFLLLAGGDVNMLSGSGDQSALHIASSFGLCDIMVKLIQNGADCNHLTSSGKSALDFACENNHETAVELLLKNGAKPDIETSTVTSKRRGYFSYDAYQSSMSALYSAVKSDSETMVKMPLKHGADVNKADEKGNTALHLATSNAIIGTLLDAGANVNATNKNGETALSAVCEKQNADVNGVETLLKFGADPNTSFPLHAACGNSDPDILVVRLLLAHGADANLEKESTLKRLLMQAFATPTSAKPIEPSPLCLACKNGNRAITDCLLTNGAAVAFADSDGNTPLHFAVERLEQQANPEDYDPIVTCLLQHDAPVNAVSRKGETPLYVACTKGLVGVVKQLLDCKADVNLTTSNSNKYPLMIACDREFRDIAMMLLDRGADANVCDDDDDRPKQTPLKFAAAHGDAVLVKRLLACGADVNQMHGVSYTALHYAVVPRAGLCYTPFLRISLHKGRSVGKESLKNVIRMMLRSGGKPNVLNQRGETPLYLACTPTDYEVCFDIVQILLEHGADPNICPPCDRSLLATRHYVQSPLSLAAVYGNVELATLLIKYGARVDHSDDFCRTALHFAIGYGDLEDKCSEVCMILAKIKRCTSTAETLLSAGADVNALDEDGASPLYLACERGKAEFIELLLSRGANPNTETVNKYPLLVACEARNNDVVKLLLEYSADVNVRDGSGRTALHLALESKSHHSTGSDAGISVLVQLLLDGGANVNAASKYGETPFYIACSNGLESVVKKMLEYSANVNGNSAKKLPLSAACKNHVSLHSFNLLIKLCKLASSCLDCIVL